MTDLHKWGVKKIVGALILLGTVALLANVAKGESRKPTDVLRCDVLNAYERICYNDAECDSYLRGYSAVITMKMQNYLGWYPNHVYAFDLNLFHDHKGLTLMVHTEAERKDKEFTYLKQWSIVCDIEGNVVAEKYDEGFRKKAETEGIK